MYVGEADADFVRSLGRVPGTFDLTNLAPGLICRDYDDAGFQGNYDYYAHAHVYTGGADPLGSRGYASVAKNPSSSKMRPAKRKARGRFCLWGIQ